MWSEKISKVFTMLCNTHDINELKIIGDLVKERQRQLENQV
jgi:hypothetical protein